jgi:hypothetical protein
MRLPKLLIETGTGTNRWVVAFRLMLAFNAAICASALLYDYKYKEPVGLTSAEQEAVKLKEEGKLLARRSEG